jgi:NAD(P)H-flavin reductase
MEGDISCPDSAIPPAGQFLLADDPGDLNIVLRTPLFLVERSKNGFWASSLIATTWGLGTNLDLVGPLGHGFSLPRSIQRLGLVVLGATNSRLTPVIHQASEAHVAMTLFSDLSVPKLPAAVEVYPLAALPDSLDWPDFMVLDVPLQRLAHLRAVTGLPQARGLPCPAQVIITSPMPCAGMAQCGACAVPTRKGWKLACEDGPVFDLSVLKW